MKITAVEVREIHIPLKFQFSQSNNAGTRQSGSAIVEIQTAEGAAGYGEACPRLYVTGESMASVRNGLQQMEPELKGASLNGEEDIKAFLERWEKKEIGNSTLCAVELALLDAWSRAEGQPLVKLLSATPLEEFRYSLILPLASQQAFSALLPQVSHFRPSKVKLKANKNTEDTLAKLRLVRKYFGEDISIRLDINGGWSRTEAREFIPLLMEAGVFSFEQPLPANDLKGAAQLVKLFGRRASIMADESLLSIERAHQLLEEEAANHFNLKVSKLGGIFRSLDIYRLAQKNNIPCQLGAHFGETSILTSAGILLSSLTGEMTAHEGAMGEWLLEKDPWQPALQHDKSGRLSTGALQNRPGWGLSVNKDSLEKYTQPVMPDSGRVLSNLKQSIKKQ